MVDEVHVNTSLAGFEALLRQKSVTTYGVPFYAGWGLTTDLGPVPTRRTAKRSIDELVAATRGAGLGKRGNAALLDDDVRREHRRVGRHGPARDDRPLPAHCASPSARIAPAPTVPCERTL